MGEINMDPVDAQGYNPNEKVFLAMPNYGQQVHEGLIDAVKFASVRPIIKSKLALSFSVLTHNFNLLYAHALNTRAETGVTHFAMVHSDIVPEKHWLEKLMNLMNKHDADVMSVVVPIKRINAGITSTALDERSPGRNPKFHVRRLTLNEIYEDYAPTFTHPNLLVNTGCFLMRITQPWAEKFCFRFENEIIKNEEGKFVPEMMSEDWLFSRDVKKLGAKVYATREVAVIHEGQAKFSNSKWGEWSRDKGV